MLTQRQATLGIFALQTLGALGLLISSVALQQEGWIFTLASVVLFGAMMIAYWRHVSWVRYLNIALLTFLTGFSVQEPFLTQQFSPAVLAVPVLILILADWRWMVGSTIVLLGILIWRAGGTGPYAVAGNIAIVATAIGGMVIARLITDGAQRLAERSAVAAAESAERAEQNAQALASANIELSKQIETQQNLIGLVGTLETPAVVISPNVLLAPLIGHLDSRRAAAVTERLLGAVNERRTQLLILDVTGVAIVDTQVAAALLRMVRTVELLGCQMTLTGISAAVAIAITNLGLDLADLATARDPQDALSSFLATSSSAPHKQEPLALPVAERAPAVKGARATILPGPHQRLRGSGR